MKKKDKDEWDVPAFPPLGPVITDPFGSYTGRPTDVMETPVQDADDL